MYIVRKVLQFSEPSKSASKLRKNIAKNFFVPNGDP